ncbi:metallophosphoesterase family protein [Lysobacter sp. A3-1-A15]|uniref:metallophosphoesterase family protein n=1 Tax=Novilysobacter viscosus TaxID=3098602 RepID=UPI002ED859B8
MRIGVISDTHGLLRPEALSFLHGCDHIVHAGDIGRVEVVHALAGLAPLTAIRGNIDTGDWADAYPATATVALGGHRVHVLHDLKQLALDPAAAGLHAVIAGHSHAPRIDHVDGVLHLNPGSAGPRRFKLPVTVAEIRINGEGLHPRIVQLA